MRIHLALVLVFAHLASAAKKKPPVDSANSSGKQKNPQRSPKWVPWWGQDNSVENTDNSNTPPSSNPPTSPPPSENDSPANPPVTPYPGPDSMSDTDDELPEVDQSVHSDASAPDADSEDEQDEEGECGINNEDCQASDSLPAFPPAGYVKTCSPAVKAALETPTAYINLVQKCVPSSADVAALDLCVETQMVRLGFDPASMHCLSCIKTLMSAVQALPPAQLETCVTSPISSACYASLTKDLNAFAYCSGVLATRASGALPRSQLVPVLTLLLIIANYYSW